MSPRRIALPALLALVAACQSTPRALTDADRATIRSLEDSFAMLAAKGSFTALVDLYYTDDAILLAPNAPAAVGHAAIEAALRMFPPIASFSLKSHDIEGEGDLAVSYGSYALSMNVPGAPGPVNDEGKSLVVYKRQPSGGWKAWRDIFNSSLPPMGSGGKP